MPLSGNKKRKKKVNQVAILSSRIIILRESSKPFVSNSVNLLKDNVFSTPHAFLVLVSMSQLKRKDHSIRSTNLRMSAEMNEF